MNTILERRGGHVEGIHPFSAVAVQNGEVVGRIGPAIQSTWRSAAKPFQLRESLRVLGDPRLPDRCLAVGAASHTAQPEHLIQVRQVLSRFGVEESALRCGPHAPLHAPTAIAVTRSGLPFTDIHNNCSGKHAFMIAASRAAGWLADYRPPDHPLQQAIRRELVALGGVEPGHGVDGCGVPTFVMPLAAFARAWLALAMAMLGEGDPMLGRIGHAMRQHPELVSGTGRLDLDVSLGATEPLVIKIGARALHCIALPERRLAIVVKVHSGAVIALPLATETALQTFAPGAFARPDSWGWHQVRNVVGAVVGDLVVERS
jgi:L-asparaginase II